MAADVRGYYSALGLNAGVPIDAVRAAFRQLAKECHPDRPGCIDGGQRFRRIAEAYEALSDPSFKVAYDKGSEPNPPSNSSNAPPPPKVKPIQCEVCGGITAQPRRLAFWRVTSFLLASQKTPIQKIFCSGCAMKEQWKSTMWTGLLGWWGVPWGPIWSIGHGITNATGGARDQAIDERLLWQNAVAFAARGEGELATGLSNILRRSEDSEIAQGAVEIVRFFSERGFDAATTLKDVWQRSLLRSAAFLTIALAVPVVALALIFLPTMHTSQRSTTSGTSNAFTDTLGPTGATSPEPIVVSAPKVPPEGICKSLPSNGQVLVDHRGRLADGHHLKIENGTAGDAIIKVRPISGGTLASFFVARGQTATLKRIPDGTYSVQYASGAQLAKNCRSFVNDGSAYANAFPEADTFETRYQEDYDGTSVIHSEFTYTLYPVAGGTVHPNSMNMDEFNQP